MNVAACREQVKNNGTAVVCRDEEDDHAAIYIYIYIYIYTCVCVCVHRGVHACVVVCIGQEQWHRCRCSDEEDDNAVICVLCVDICVCVFGMFCLFDSVGSFFV
jgi:hypothetical protein